MKNLNMIEALKKEYIGMKVTFMELSHFMCVEGFEDIYDNGVEKDNFLESAVFTKKIESGEIEDTYLNIAVDYDITEDDINIDNMTIKIKDIYQY